MPLSGTNEYYMISTVCSKTIQNPAAIAIKIPISSPIHTTNGRRSNIIFFYFIFHDQAAATTLFYIHIFSTFQISEGMLFSNIKSYNSLNASSHLYSLSHFQKMENTFSWGEGYQFIFTFHATCHILFHPNQHIFSNQLLLHFNSKSLYVLH